MKYFGVKNDNYWQILICIFFTYTLSLDKASAQALCPSLQSRSYNVGPEAFDGNPGVLNSDFRDAVEIIQAGLDQANGQLAAWQGTIWCPAGCQRLRGDATSMHVFIHGIDPIDPCYAQHTFITTSTASSSSCQLAELNAALGLPGGVSARAEELCRQNGPECSPHSYYLNLANLEGSLDEFESTCTASLEAEARISCGRGESADHGEIMGYVQGSVACWPIVVTNTTDIPIDPPPPPSDNSNGPKNRPTTPLACGLYTIRGVAQCAGDCPTDNECYGQLSCQPFLGGCSCLPVDGGECNAGQTSEFELQF